MMKNLKCFALQAEADSGGASTAIRLLCGIVGILLIVYLLAELTPRLAALIDKTEKPGGEDKKPPVQGGYDDHKVYDPYEGQMEKSADEGDNNITEEENGKEQQ